MEHSTKIGSKTKYSVNLKAEMAKKTVYTTMVRDQDGNPIRPDMKLSQLYRFSGAAKSGLPSRAPAVAADEELIFTIPKLGDKAADKRATFRVLAWMEDQAKAPQGTLLEISPEDSNHSPLQLIQITSSAYALEVLPRAARDTIATKTINAVTDITQKGELSSDLVILAVQLFPEDHYVVRQFFKAIARVAFYSSDKEAEEAIYTIVREAVAKLPIVDGLMANALRDEEYRVWKSEKDAYYKTHRKRSAARKTSKKDGDTTEGGKSRMAPVEKPESNDDQRVKVHDGKTQPTKVLGSKGRSEGKGEASNFSIEKK